MKKESKNFAFHTIKVDDIKSILKKRPVDSHKRTFGHALMMSGSKGMMGACVLSSEAILRSGAGLLTIYIPKAGELIVQTSIPEAMVIVDSNENHIQSFPDLSKYSAIGVGPGIGTASKTKNAIADFINHVSIPTIFDADALNIIYQNKELLQHIPHESVLTPHEREFERLVGSFDNINDRTELQKNLSIQYQINILVKGPQTCMTNSTGDIFINSTGNPGMATGGSGDVLTGIMTGLVARGLSPFNAMISGAYLHGLSGDIARGFLGEESMTAQDLVDYLGQSFLKVI